MKVLVTGGTGFIGRALVAELLALGHEVAILARRPAQRGFWTRRARRPPRPPFHGGRAFFSWDASREEPPRQALEGAEVIFHLAGENIFGYWTEAKKKRIFDSRILGTHYLISAIARIGYKPRVLIMASAVGYYGDRGEEELDEESSPGSDFLATVCQAWEKEASAAESLGIRTVMLRIAPVLGKGGLLAKITPIFKLGLGGVLSSGQQWMPWIHLGDMVRICLFAMENTSLSGPVNASSPNPVRNEEFTKMLAQALHRPALLRIPPFALRAVFSELGDAILASQQVLPRKLLATGFRFRFPDIKSALEDIFAS